MLLILSSGWPSLSGTLPETQSCHFPCSVRVRKVALLYRHVCACGRGIFAIPRRFSLCVSWLMSFGLGWGSTEVSGSHRKDCWHPATNYREFAVLDKSAAGAENAHHQGCGVPPLFKAPFTLAHVRVCVCVAATPNIRGTAFSIRDQGSYRILLSGSC